MLIVRYRTARDMKIAVQIYVIHSPRQGVLLFDSQVLEEYFFDRRFQVIAGSVFSLILVKA
jgi:hypothetical protein